MAPTIFTKTTAQMIRQKLGYSLISIIVGIGFASVFFIAEEGRLTGGLIAVLCIAIFIALFMLFATVKDMVQISSNGEDWTVEVSNEKLSWHSPLPNQMKSFETKLCDIASVEFKKIRFRSNGSSNIKKYKQYFHIRFRDGKSLKLDPFRSGINPFKVFEELERRGVRFDKLEERKGSRITIRSSV